MAAITKTPSKTWKAIIRKRGWPIERRRGEGPVQGLRQTFQFHARRIARIALYTGMRAGEIKSVTCQQVNLQKRTVLLTETRNGSVRTVPLTREPAEIFRLALNNPARPLKVDLIFWGEPGRDGVHRPYEFHTAWHRVLKQAGTKGLRFYDLRHEAVSRLV